MPVNSEEIVDYSLRHDTDVIVYSGPIDRSGYAAMCNVLRSPRRRNALVAVLTYGGDPHAGYRIARALHHNYETGQISLLVPDLCKSAGTLICIGAQELVIADEGELGPLDVQVAKPDEMFASGSGLDIMRGLTNLRFGVKESFRDYLLEINAGSGVSTKMAAEVATKLAVGTFEPVFAQIDPIRLGEMEAALSIANAYGKRLADKSKNLKPGALARLVNSYPSHSFVIDRKEARELFKNVRPPDSAEQRIGELVKNTIWKNGAVSQGNPQIVDLIQLLQSIPTNQDTINEAPSVPPTRAKPGRRSNIRKSARSEGGS